MLPGNRSQGLVRGPGLSIRCALGRSGVAVLKREGDGACPAGRFTMLAALYRSDRVSRPRTGLPLAVISPDDGWCDDVGDRNYNRAVRLPYAGGNERLWRTDGLYDLVIVLSHNRRPRVRGLGSAVFIHVCRVGYAPTEGCIGLPRAALLKLLTRVTPGQPIEIGL